MVFVCFRRICLFQIQYSCWPLAYNYTPASSCPSLHHWFSETIALDRWQTSKIVSCQLLNPNGQAVLVFPSLDSISNTECFLLFGISYSNCAIKVKQTGIHSSQTTNTRWPKKKLWAKQVVEAIEAAIVLGQLLGFFIVLVKISAANRIKWQSSPWGETPKKNICSCVSHKHDSLLYYKLSFCCSCLSVAVATAICACPPARHLQIVQQIGECGAKKLSHATGFYTRYS